MTTKTAAPAIHCRKCHRPLTSLRSIREATRNGGYGRGCARKVAENVRAAALSETVTDEALELVEDGGAVQVTPAMWATVSTDGKRTYLTSALAGTCTCKSGQFGRLCCHLAAVAALLDVYPVAAPVVIPTISENELFANIPNAA